MRAFVLCTGRCGSVTFVRACEHAENFTAGHESRADRWDARLDYPDDHIEADNRLAWMLGPLGRTHPDAFYVHLVRDPDAVARSFARRYYPRRPFAENLKRASRRLRRGGNMISLTEMWVHGVTVTNRRLDEPDRVRVCRAMVDAITANIEMYLHDRAHLTIDIAGGADRIGEFWERIGAVGDLGAARAEFATSHNASVT